MATFQVRIEDLVGVVEESYKNGTSDTVAINDALSEACTEIINMMPPHLLSTVTTTSSDQTSNGVSLPNMKLVDVIRESGVDGDYVLCKPMNISYETKVQNASSPFYATKQNPVFIIKNGLIYVYPAPGDSPDAFKYTSISYPSPLYSDSSIGQSYKQITGVAGEADDETFTLNSHGFENGDKVELSGFAGDTALNGIVSIIENKTTNTFKLANVTIDTDATGGTVTSVVSGFPDELEYIVVYGAAVRCGNHLMSNIDTEIKDAMDNAKKLFDVDLDDDDNSDTAESILHWLNDEDPEMVQATSAGAQAELSRVQTLLAEKQSLQQNIQNLSGMYKGAIQAAGLAQYGQAQAQEE